MLGNRGKIALPKGVIMRCLQLLVFVTVSMIAAIAPWAQDNETEEAKRVVIDYLNQNDWPSCYAAVDAWIRLSLSKRLNIIGELLKFIESVKQCDLDRTDGMVPGFPTHGREIKFYGSGFVVWQDMFLEGGKAAWAIEHLIGAPLPQITLDLPTNERESRALRIRCAVKAYKNGVEDGRKDALTANTQKDKK